MAKAQSAIELFFTLITLFAITQLSHTLFLHLNYHGMLQTGVLWLAVWLSWRSTTEFFSCFDLHKLSVRLITFGIILVSVLMASMIPTAFNYNGLIFALCYVSIQVGRTLVVLLLLGNNHELALYFRRMILWLCISTIFWILGGLAESEHRLAYWAFAVSIECIAPLFGPSISSERISEDDHLGNRYQLLMIVAFGAALFEAGLTVSNTLFLNLTTIIGFIVACLGTLAMWWLYFESIIKDFNEDTRSLLPYIHVILIVGIIGFTVAGELMISDATNHLKTPSLVVLVTGPIIFLIGNAILKMKTYHHIPFSHLMGILTLVLLVPFADYADTLRIGEIIVTILVMIALMERFTIHRLTKVLLK